MIAFSFANIGAPELLVVLAIVVLLFGARRIPELMTALGKGVKTLKEATREDAIDVPDAPEKPKV